jgi:non-specific serine/threonine protein kinase
MVTLTGMGGVGKSRLALRVADQARRSFADGVWQVELAAVEDPELLPRSFVDALGIEVPPTRDPLDALSSFLAPRQLLLLVDDCEHLVPACAPLFTRLLRAAPGLRLLITSREVLGVAGERVFQVAPLAVPDPASRSASAALRVEAVGRYPGVALFVERAREVRPEFALTPENVDTVSRVCHRLDGLPLALELAAARLRSLGVEDLDRRLDDGFSLLTSHSAVIEPRHRALRAAVGWSFRLCTQPERLLWKRASVFAGRFDLEAAESVCVSARLRPDHVMDVLTGLTDKSVVIAEELLGASRYRMLEVVRQYGQDRLRTCVHDEADADDLVDETVLRRRHLAFYQQMAERLNGEWFGPDEVRWSQRLRAELPNLRAALGLCVADRADLAGALRLAGALGYLWWGCGEVSEGLLWLERAGAAEPAPTIEWVRAMTTYGRLLEALGRGAAAVGPGRSCLDVARTFDDPVLLIEALVVLGHNLVSGGAPEEGVSLLDEALELAGDLSDTPQALAPATLYRGAAAVFTGDVECADRLLSECRALCTSHGDLHYLGHALGYSVLVALLTGRVAEADALARTAVPLHQRLHDTLGLRVAVEHQAWTADAVGDHRRAARLLGAAATHARLLGGSPRWPGPFLDAHRRCEASVRTALGDTEFQTRFQLGAERGTDELGAPAGGDPATDARPTAGHGGGPPELTRREIEIAALVADGLSNRDIAARLVIAQRTAEGHVRNILVKLGFTSRTQIGVWYMRQSQTAG